MSGYLDIIFLLVLVVVIFGKYNIIFCKIVCFFYFSMVYYLGIRVMCINL